MDKHDQIIKVATRQAFLQQKKCDFEYYKPALIDEDVRRATLEAAIESEKLDDSLI